MSASIRRQTNGTFRVIRDGSTFASGLSEKRATRMVRRMNSAGVPKSTGFHTTSVARSRLEAFAQGARCGHIEGKGRAGQYVIGEEGPLANEAAENQGLGFPLSGAWARGYSKGYRLAAEGSALPSDAELQEIARLHTPMKATDLGRTDGAVETPNGEWVRTGSLVRVKSGKVYRAKVTGAIVDFRQEREGKAYGPAFVQLKHFSVIEF